MSDLVRSKSSDSVLSNVNGNINEYVHLSEDGTKLTHEVVQDVEPVLNWCKDQALNPNAGKSESGEWYHAARIPTVVVLEWLKQKGLTMADLKGDVIDQLLNDRDNSAFRIWQGRC